MKQSSTSQRFERIRRFYVGFALIFLTTLLVVGSLLGAIHLGLDLIEWARGPERVYARSFDLSAFTEVDEAGALAIVTEFDLHASGGRDSEGIGEYEYQPWSGFTERPFAGAYLNVDERQGYTIRRTSAPAPARAGDQQIIVWTFGGSTQFGFGMSDDETISSHLQRDLQARLPTSHVVVVNHGHGWWYSSQEVIHFLALLRLEDAPQIAVFLDGFNDSFITSHGYRPSYYTPVLWDAWEAERRRRQYPAPGGWWLQLTQSFPTVRLQRILQPLASSPGRFPDHLWTLPDRPVRQVLELYRMNRKIAAAIAEAFGVQAHFFLQPISISQRLSELTLRRSYDALIAEAKAETFPGFVSLHDALDDIETAYIDSNHYNERASRELATRMADVIAQGIKGARE